MRRLAAVLGLSVALSGCAGLPAAMTIASGVVNIVQAYDALKTLRADLKTAAPGTCTTHQ